MTQKTKRPGRIEKLKKERIGKVSYTNYGTPAILIDYIAHNRVLIQFQDKYKYEYYVEYSKFINGQIENPYDKTVLNAGFIGVGKYRPTKNGKVTKQYNAWRNMLARCYDEEIHNVRNTYECCEVCDEWLNFQTFAQWYDEHFYQCGTDKMHLDKDILYKGNKLYCPEHCIFVPMPINELFTKTDKLRGDLPIGVSYSKDCNKYVVHCNQNIMRTRKGERKYLGKFDNEIDAFNVYKKYKEALIKQVADEYKEIIPKKLYDAMYNYKVDITD